MPKIRPDFKFRIKLRSYPSSEEKNAEKEEKKLKEKLLSKFQGK